MAGGGTAGVTRPPIREVATLHTVLPVVFAVCAALSNAVATVLQRKAALTVPRSQGLRAGLIADLLRRPVWLAGIVAVIGAAVCQALALATGPLTIVQPLFVLELPLTLIVASLLMRRHLPARAGWQWRWWWPAWRSRSPPRPPPATARMWSWTAGSPRSPCARGRSPASLSPPCDALRAGPGLRVWVQRRRSATQ
jgi:drug/metabolite transporter (DMT)-like permease